MCEKHMLAIISHRDRKYTAAAMPFTNQIIDRFTS